MSADPRLLTAEKLDEIRAYFESLTREVQIPARGNGLFLRRHIEAQDEVGKALVAALREMIGDEPYGLYFKNAREALAAAPEAWKE